jgi:hypothetical protein
MGRQTEIVMVGLEMANPASSRGMVQVLQALQPLVPIMDPGTGTGQNTLLLCDQNFYERGRGSHV